MMGLAFAIACLNAAGFAWQGMGSYYAAAVLWERAGHKPTEAGMRHWLRGLGLLAVSLLSAGIAGWLLGRGA
jgi:hypothetical protein